MISTNSIENYRNLIIRSKDMSLSNTRICAALDYKAGRSKANIQRLYDQVLDGRFSGPQLVCWLWLSIYFL